MLNIVWSMSAALDGPLWHRDNATWPPAAELRRGACRSGRGCTGKGTAVSVEGQGPFQPDGPQARFHAALRGARKVAVLTGAGVSAESGIPTYRGEGGLWRSFDPTKIATPEAWQENPGLLWQFVDAQRRKAQAAEPNAGHRAIAELEARWVAAGGVFSLITQNIDGLHERAGSSNVANIHGSLWEVRCVACHKISANREVPITPAFAEPSERRITEAELPHCDCGGVQRPNLVLFGEEVSSKDLVACADAIDKCQLMIIAGTSAVVYPAAGLVPLAKRYGTRFADVNVEPSGVSHLCDWVIEGKSGEILPALLDVTPEWPPG